MYKKMCLLCYLSVISLVFMDIRQIRFIFRLPVFVQFVKTVSYEMLAFGLCLRMQTSDGLLNAAHFALTDEF